MKDINNIKAELESLGSNLPLPAGTSLTVPDGYFEGLAASVLARLKSDVLSAAEETQTLSPLLAGLSKKMPYAVPQGYFRDNISAIDSFIAEEETPSFGKLAQPYSVPAGYFDGLPAAILAKVFTAGAGAKVVPMRKRAWMRMAVAAAVAGIIVFSGIFYFNSKNTVSVDNPQWVAQNISTISTTSLDDFIKKTDVTPASASSGNNIADVKALVKDIPTQELDQFLSSLPADDEAYN